MANCAPVLASYTPSAPLTCCTFYDAWQLAQFDVPGVWVRLQSHAGMAAVLIYKFPLVDSILAIATAMTAELWWIPNSA